MPRMNILNTVEREAFDSPPMFNGVERKHYLGLLPLPRVRSLVKFQQRYVKSHTVFYNSW